MPVPHNQTADVYESRISITFNILDDTSAFLWYVGEDAVESTYTRMSKEEAMECFFSSLKAHHQTLLQPIWTTEDSRSGEWLVFYKPFSPLTSPYPLTNQQLFSSARYSLFCKLQLYLHQLNWYQIDPNYKKTLVRCTYTEKNIAYTNIYTLLKTQNN